MSNIDDYNKLVDFIGNIIKATSEPEDQAALMMLWILHIPLEMH